MNKFNSNTKYSNDKHVYRCNEVIGLRSELQEANEKNLNFQKNGFEGAVSLEINRRLESFVLPINTLIKEIFDSLMILLEGATKVCSSNFEGTFNIK